MSQQRPEKIVVCSHNQGKLREIRAILEDLDIALITPREMPDLPDPVEDGDTFLDNARIKARSAFAFCGLPSLGDDSGLVVPALGGEPGVYSARYANAKGDARDPANRKLLRDKLRERDLFPADAYFICLMVLQLDEETEVTFEGRCDGVIHDEERGDGGFGYDSLFTIPSLKATFAQLPPNQKNQISHRGLALASLRQWLEQTLS